ncbi:hypothetical protein MTO96_035479 [Rhipicephalus appendiculatus]
MRGQRFPNFPSRKRASHGSGTGDNGQWGATSASVTATPTAETSQVKEDGTGVTLQAEDWAMETSSGTAGKRSRDHVEDGSGAGDAGVGEPPSKALPTRRSALRPRPSLPPDRRPAASPSS